ncbi:MAG: flagellar basal-body rod protein FlgB [Verrucomicrobia bacterium GWF2_51_19]|nr:MAG: flagellar basal-body rod protein FlgB [Verrucomicrobia bacterium GWF2_51_19]HCJ12450.1 flagellar basal body rod protein FlgB [Opitutae bacterium]
MIDGLYNQEAYNAAKKMMELAVQKHEAYANNLANMETPGYKRVEIDTNFQSKLQEAVKNGDIKTLQTLQPKFVKDVKTPQVRADGNNVELDRELLHIKQNALEHELAAKVMSSSLSRLKLAIKGRQ